MKLITTARELEKEFRRLTEQYDHFYWSTAWASSGSKPFNYLLTNKGKIQKIVVGIHFYQTHPDFIEAFLDNQNVHFIQQPKGTFHPKLYLFKDNANRWEMLIGSANFTTAAFTINTEASLLITHEASNEENIFKNALRLVDQTFTAGKTFNVSDLDDYRIIWKIHRQKINSLSGQYGSIKGNPKPIHEISMMTRSWEDYMKIVMNDKIYGIEKRLRVLEIAKSLFNNVDHYNELAEDERKFIAGIPNRLDIDGAEDWVCFGSMMGAGIFRNKIKKNDENVSTALDNIPLSGHITKKHYKNYIKYFAKTFSGNYLATATRLLCMKRPDTFVCFNSQNLALLCMDFGIIQTGMNYERYWDDIVERIYDSNWWQNPDPKDDIEIKSNLARAALLDSLYYGRD